VKGSMRMLALRKRTSRRRAVCVHSESLHESARCAGESGRISPASSSGTTAGERSVK
jgi:hypothetical protein